MKQAVSTLLFAAVLAGMSHDAHADAKTECVDAFEAGQTARAAAKLTEALAQFSICARDVCPHSLQKACVDQATETSALQPSIVLSATDGSHADVTDVTVTIDGKLVTRALDGRAMPIDPGVHTVRFERTGSPAVERQVLVKEAQQGQAITAQLGASVDAPSPAATVSAGWSTMRKAGVGLGAVGVASAAVGGVFGALAYSKWSAAQSDAREGNRPEGESVESTGKSFAAVSTAAFIAGGVLVAGGVGLFIAGSSKAGPTVGLAMAPSPGGFLLVGGF